MILSFIAWAKPFLPVALTLTLGTTVVLLVCATISRRRPTLPRSKDPELTGSPAVTVPKHLARPPTPPHVIPPPPAPPPPPALPSPPSYNESMPLFGNWTPFRVIGAEMTEMRPPNLTPGSSAIPHVDRSRRPSSLVTIDGSYYTVDTIGGPDHGCQPEDGLFGEESSVAHGAAVMSTGDLLFVGQQFDGVLPQMHTEILSLQSVCAS